jgi:DNA-binding MarR family transcriptional regulator
VADPLRGARRTKPAAQADRALAAALLRITEHPSSGREKQVELTRRGEQRLERMVERGAVFIQTMVDRLSAAEAESGVHFLSRVSEIIDALDAEGALRRQRRER